MFYVIMIYIFSILIKTGSNCFKKNANEILCISYALSIVAQLLIYTEAVARRCSVKNVFLKILQNSQGNTCVRCFPVNFAKILKTLFSIDHLRLLILPILYKVWILTANIHLTIWIDKKLYHIFVIKKHLPFYNH